MKFSHWLRDDRSHVNLTSILNLITQTDLLFRLT